MSPALPFGRTGPALSWRWLIVLACTGWPAVARSAEFRHDFRDGPPDASALHAVGRHRGQVEWRADGLVISIPAGSSRPDPIGFVLGFGLAGSVEITAEYKILESAVPSDGYGSGVGLFVRSDSAARETLTMERFLVPKVGKTFRSSLITTRADGPRKYRIQEWPASGDSGMLRLVRQGREAAARCTDEGGRLVDFHPVSFTATPLWYVRLAADTGRSDAALKVLLRRLTVRADAFLERPGPLPAVSSRRLLTTGALVFGSGLVFTLCAGYFARARRSPIDHPDPDGRAPAERLESTVTMHQALAGAMCVLVISLVNHVLAAKHNETHIDERDWTARAYFYRLAFINSDPFHRLWVDADGIDQPHVTDFLIGAALEASGRPVPPVPLRATPWSDDGPPPADVLAVARAPGAVLGALVAVLVFAIGILVTGRLDAGLIAGIAYACHPLPLSCQPMAMSDAPLMFFGTMAMLLTVLAIPGAAVGRAAVVAKHPWYVLAAIASSVGLAVGSKLTGIFAGITVALILTLFQRRWSYLVAFLLMAEACTIAFNPTLYSDPVGGFLEMLQHRRELGTQQAAAHPQSRVDGIPARLYAVYDYLGGGATGRPPVWPIAALACVGVASLSARAVGRRQGSRPDARSGAVLVWSAVLLVGLAPSLPLRWGRYYLPFLPCWCLFVGAGAAAVWTVVDRTWKRAWVAGVRGKAWRIVAWSSLAASTALWFLVLDPNGRPVNQASEAGIHFATLRAAARAIAAGLGAPAYDPSDLATFDGRSGSGAGERAGEPHQSLPPSRVPPAFLLVASPAAVLDVQTGFLCWVAAITALVLVIIRRTADPLGRGAWPIAFASLLFLPLAEVLAGGAITVLALVGMFLVQRNLERGRDGFAGFSAGLLAVTPELAPALGLVFLGTRRWRAAAGLACAGLLILLVSLATAGIAGCSAFLSTLRPSAVSLLGIRDGRLEASAGLRPLLARWLSGSNVLGSRVDEATLLLFLAAGAGVLALVWHGPWEPGGERLPARLLATAIVACLLAEWSDLASASALLVPGLSLYARGGGSRALSGLLKIGFIAPFACAYASGWTPGVPVAFTLWMLATLAMLVVWLRTGGVDPTPDRHAIPAA